MSPIAASVDEFPAAVPPDKRAALEDLRTVIQVAAPDATALINYGVPMFRLGGKNLVSYATSKGTVRFTPDKPIPAALVTKLVKARIAELGMD